ncbi:MAG TPA: MbcA/ParS/Xre antitoxin family protein [Longimicrobiales bacterium]|nr:MbcA/ParS/Xre antitoxin family protein [Longimicrobiales bacterium]
MALPAASDRPVTEPQMAQAGLRTFFRIAGLWDLSVEEQITLLGSPARSTYFKWKREGVESLPRDVLERISYVLGIYKDLQLLLPDEEAADTWVRRPNDAPPFGGRSALERMLSGNVSDLYEVRRYLDAERGG